MKAIQIKYMAPTDTKPSRLKAWTEGGWISECVRGDLDGDAQAYALAEKVIEEMG